MQDAVSSRLGGTFEPLFGDPSQGCLGHGRAQKAGGYRWLVLRGLPLIKENPTSPVAS